jgi:hypothetical protein
MPTGAAGAKAAPNAAVDGGGAAARALARPGRADLDRL